MITAFRMPGRRVLALAVLLALAAGADAQQWYAVEIVAFEDTTGDGLAEQVWPLDPGTPDLAGAVQLRDPAELGLPDEGGPVAFAMLPRKALKLGGVARRLARSGRYEPVLHLGWLQPGFSRSRAPRTFLRAWQAGDAAPALEGTVRVYRSKYLHVDVDLVHRRAAGLAASAASGQALTAAMPAAFRFATSRRMRSNELHYLDHPLFGVLMLVTPYAPPADE